MSLINQMLKDLDARKQQGPNHGGQEVEVVVYHTPKRFRFLPVIVALVVVLAVSALGGWWFFNPRTVATPQLSALTQSPVNGAPVAVEPQAVVEIETVVEEPITLEEQVAPRLESSVVQELSAPVMAPVLPDVAVALAETPAANIPAESSNRRDETAFAVALEGVSSLPVRMVIKPPSLAEQVQHLRIEGRALVEQQRYQAGAKLLNQAIQIDHSSAQPWQELVRIWVQAGDLASAMDVATRGCEVYPTDVGLRVYRARLMVESGEHGSALVVLQTGALPTIEASSDYYALLASVLQQLNRFDEAAEQYLLLTTTYPHQGDWWIGRAICADQLGSPQQAMACYQQAISCRQLNPQLKQFAVQQLTRLGKG